MELGAVLIATGKQANPMHNSGDITVAQRMIATLQKAGVSLIAVVTGPDDRKMEKQLAQYGVFFLQNPQPEQENISICMGLQYLSPKCERIYLLSANFPLVDPDTLLSLREIDVPFVIPIFRNKRGQPLLLKQQYATKVLKARNLAAFLTEQSATELTVEDPGVILTAEEASMQQDLIAAHERKLTRLTPDFSITRGKTLLDKKLVALLRLIRETRSVRDACSRMQISYSTAWNLLNGAEEALGYPLILRNKGGPSGSGSLMTEKGECLLTACDRFEAEARENLESLYGRFLEKIL